MVERWSSKSHAWVRFLLSLIFLKNFFKQNKYVLNGTKYINYRHLLNTNVYNMKNVYNTKQKSGGSAHLLRKNLPKERKFKTPITFTHYFLTLNFTQFNVKKLLKLNLKPLFKISLNSIFYRCLVDRCNFINSFNFWNYSWLYLNNTLLNDNFKHFFCLVGSTYLNSPKKIHEKTYHRFHYFRAVNLNNGEKINLKYLHSLKEIRKLVVLNIFKLKNKYQVLSFKKDRYNVFALKRKIHSLGTNVYRKHRFFEVQLFRFLIRDLRNKYLISPTLDGGFYGHNDSKYSFLIKRRYWAPILFSNFNLVHNNLNIYNYMYRSYELNFDGVVTTLLKNTNSRCFFFKNINLSNIYSNGIFRGFSRKEWGRSFKINWYTQYNSNAVSSIKRYKDTKNFIFKRDIKITPLISNPNIFNYYLINNFSLIKIFSSPLFFKYFLLLLNKNLNYLFFDRKFNLFNLFNSHHYSIEYLKLNNSNLFFNQNLKHAITKKVMLSNAVSRFRLKIIPFVLKTLIDFLENISGRKVILMFNPFLMKYLTFEEIARCLIWYRNLLYFRRVLGHHLFLLESLKIVYLALKLKDPVFFVNWVKQMLYKISFYKFKFFLRYLKYIIRAYFQHIFHTIDFKGVKIQLKGKVSVSGNARTRTVRQTIGKVGQSTLNNRVLYNMQTIWTFTGSISLRVWFYF